MEDPAGWARASSDPIGKELVKKRRKPEHTSTNRGKTSARKWSLAGAGRRKKGQITIQGGPSWERAELNKI